MNKSINRRTRIRLMYALIFVGWCLMSCEPKEPLQQPKKMVIHTSMDVYLINIDSMTVEMGRTDSVYRFNDFALLARFVMDRTKEEVSEQRAYWLELNRRYNERK